MGVFRPEIEALEQNGITRTAFRRLGDPDVIPLWFGEGDFVTDPLICDAATTALEEGYTYYGHTLGRQELRTAIKNYLDRLYDITLDVERITVPGSSMLGVTMAVQMAVGPDDHIIVVTPHWPNIDRAISVVGADMTFVRQDLSDGDWSLSLDAVRDAITPATRALYVNSPSNPTGWIMTRDNQVELLDLCRERGIVIIADEVYHRTVYDGEVAPSFLEIARDDDPVISINGFSKAYAMTGWRLGWMVTPAGYREQMAVLSECFNTSAPAFIQRAGVTALNDGENIVHELRDHYRAGREIVTRILGRHPRIELAQPEGAFYAFPRIPGLASSSDFVNTLLDEENVGVAPGYTFGPGNDEHFRLCFAQSHERLELALERIARFIDRY